MASEGCMRCIRYLVFVFNFLFWFVGIGLFGLAMFLRLSEHGSIQLVANFSQDVISTLAYVMMAIGGVLTIVGFMGCCGAYQESTCLLGTFFLCLMLMLAAEMSAAVYVFVERDPIRDKYTNFLLQTVREFDWTNRSVETAALKSKQRMFQCCGAYNSSDYLGYYYVVYNGFPESCCVNTSGNIAPTTTPPTAAGTTAAPPPAVCKKGKEYPEGCAPKFFQWLSDNLLWVAIGGSIIAVLEVVGMVMAILLCCHLRNLGYEATADTENLMF